MVTGQMSIFDLIGQLNKDCDDLNNSYIIDESEFEKVGSAENESNYANDNVDLDEVLSIFTSNSQSVSFRDEIISDFSSGIEIISDNEVIELFPDKVESICNTISKDSFNVQNADSIEEIIPEGSMNSAIEAPVENIEEISKNSSIVSKVNNVEGIYVSNNKGSQMDTTINNSGFDIQNVIESKEIMIEEPVSSLIEEFIKKTENNVKSFAKAKKAKSKKAEKPKLRYSPINEEYPTTPTSRLEANLEAIKLLYKVENEGYACKSKDLSILGKFTGWGGLSQFFEPNNKRNEELRKILGEYYKSASASITTGYYTPPEIIKFKFELMKRFGFEKGRILDCSTGVGRYFSYMNKSIYEDSKLYGVELDLLSSKIASLLHPKANIVNCGFEKTTFEDDYFDLCISNIPYGDIVLYDNQDTELNKLNLRIHDYFIVKALKKVRNGGIVAFITSTGFMDKQSSKVRELVSKNANLIGAFRLPNTTFTGTNVVSDIVIFQKTKTPVENPSWIKLDNLEKFEGKYSINKYFIQKPQFVYGNFDVSSSQYGEVLTVINDDPDMTLLKDRMKHFSSYVYSPREDESYLYEEDEIITSDDIDKLVYNGSCSWVNDLRDDEYVCIDDVLYKKENSYLVKQKENMPKYNLLKSYAYLKGAILDICANKDATDDELKLMQDTLSSYYDNFINEYGYINELSNARVLSKDIAGFPLVSSLENVTEVYDAKEDKLIKIYNKADIFTKRIVGRSAVIAKPKTLQEAIMLSFFLIGKLDIALVAEKLERPHAEVVSECIENNLIYYDYELGRYENSNDFLSGYVKDKLKYYENLLDRIENGTKIITVPVEKEFFLANTEDALKHVSEIKRNIDSLKDNQPEFVENVEFGISSTWIPLDIKRKFLVDTLELGEREKYMKFEYNEKLGYSLSGCLLNSTLRTVEWGTSRVDAERIIVHALNDTAPVVKDKVDDNEVVNVEETQLAVAKVNRWVAEFKDYILNNPDLHLEMVQMYNDLFVRTVEKEQVNFIYDPEVNPSIKLRECQLKGVSRCITSKTSQLLFYETGVGKTFTMQVLAYMKYKMRMYSEGRPNKTVIVVPNSLALSGQFAREFLTIYPNAKVLGLSPKDFEKKNRRKVLSKIATNNWHAVILPHSVLDLIPLKPETLQKYYEQDIRDMEQAIYSYEQNYDRKSAFKLEKMIANRKAQMERLLDIHKDANSIYWEDLGVDDIMVDEAHNFKSLFFVTRKERIAGISNRASKCASNLFNIVRYQQEKNPSSVTFATATPITNTIGELFNFSRYLNPEGLRKRNVFEFDAWASAFGSVVNEVETDVTGRGFKLKPRFAKFYNIPELMQIVKEFADVVFTEDVAEIQVPNLVTGKPINVEVEPTELMEKAIQTLVELVGDYESGGSKKGSRYNMLKICGEGRKLAVSPRLLSADEEHSGLRDIAREIHSAKELSPKLKAVVEKAYEVYLKHPDMGQVIFCDIGVPKGDEYSAYQEMKDGLIAKGLSNEQIVFIHDCGDSPQKRQEVIKKFNDGLIKVLIGSTSKMGVGVNMQKRLVALHHVDSCWLPSDIKQREGRILRYGNLNKEVYIFRYLVKNSFDVFSWQTLERKAKFIHQISSGAKDLRSVDDLGSESISYAEAKAAASGNPLLLEHCALVSKYNELKIHEKSYALTQIKNLNRINYLKKIIPTKKHQVDLLKEEIDSVQSYDTSTVLFSRAGVEYRVKEMILEVIKDAPKIGKLGYVYGLPVEIDAYRNEIKIGESNLVTFSMVTHQAAIYRRFEVLLDSMNCELKKVTKLIQEYENELVFLEDYIKKPFTFKDELLEVERRKTDIETVLFGSKDEKKDDVEEVEANKIEPQEIDKDDIDIESKEAEQDDEDIEHLSQLSQFHKEDPIEYFEVL